MDFSTSHEINHKSLDQEYSKIQLIPSKASLSSLYQDGHLTITFQVQLYFACRSRSPFPLDPNSSTCQENEQKLWEQRDHEMSELSFKTFRIMLDNQEEGV